jgi:hypothetical protein
MIYKGSIYILCMYVCMYYVCVYWGYNGELERGDDVCSCQDKTMGELRQKNSDKRGETKENGD